MTDLGGNTVDARDIIAGRLAEIECGVDDPEYVSDGNRIDAADIIQSLETAGFRVVPADLVEAARDASECEDPPYQKRCGFCAQDRLAAALAHLDGDSPLEVFAGNP